MLRPEVRSSVIAACKLGIEHFDDAAPFRAALVPAEAEIAHQLVQPASRRRFSSCSSSPNSTSRIASGSPRTNCFERRPEHRDLAGELDHGAIDQFDRDRRQLDDVLRGIHRLMEAAEMAGADRAAAEQRPQLHFDRGRERERALGADQDVREIDVVLARAPARRDCSRRPGAAPWETAPRSRRPRARRARADRRASGRSAEFAGTSDRSAPTGPKCARVPSASMRVDREDVVAHGAVAQRACRRRNCWPAMPPMVAREAVEISTGNHRPCGLSARLRSSSTMPGSTVQRRPATSRSRMRLRYFEQSMTSDLLTVCPALRGAAAAREHRHAFRAANAIARSASSIVRGATTPTGMI